MLDRLRRILLLAALAILPQLAAAQPCEYEWLPGAPVSGLAGHGYGHATILWDPDGPGPATEVVVVGGDFDVAGDTFANNIAMWDPATEKWSPFGEGLNGAVHALTVLPSGDLVAGGEFWGSGGEIMHCVARWDGDRWRALAAESPGTAVYAMTTLPGGALVIGGSLSTSNIARLEGGTWSTIGGGMNHHVFALTVLPTGQLVAGGRFSTAGGIAARGIAWWDGASWQPLGEGVSGVVLALTVLDGDLVAGGDFVAAGGQIVNRVARWHDGQWEPFGAGIEDGAVRSLQALPGGELLAGGDLSYWVGADLVGGVLRWDGVEWRGLGFLESINDAVALPGGDVFAVGNIYIKPTLRGVARYTGDEWVPIPSGGTSRPVLALWPLSHGAMLAGGEFSMLEGREARGIARWFEHEWTPIGDGVAEARAVAASSLTAYFAAGRFSAASSGGNRIARWISGGWFPMDQGLTSTGAHALAVLPSGDLVAGGDFDRAGGQWVSNIARWSVGDWHDMGAGTDLPIHALAVHPAIGLVAGGEFTKMDGAPAQRVARWNGRDWAPIGEGLNGTVRALLPLPAGELVAGGDFTETGAGVAAPGIAIWDGAAWQPLGAIDGSVYALTVMPSGEIIAGGQFETVDGAVVNNIARWDGARWSPMGAGTNGRVAALAVSTNGTLFVGGHFTAVDGAVSAYLARWDCAPPPDCYADCDGSGDLDFFDFLCFQNRFAAGSAEADCDARGGLDFFDFLCFQNAFAAGCP
jgi:hypothetical protein